MGGVDAIIQHLDLGFEIGIGDDGDVGADEQLFPGRDLDGGDVREEAAGRQQAPFLVDDATDVDRRIEEPFHQEIGLAAADAVHGQEEGLGRIGLVEDFELRRVDLVLRRDFFDLGPAPGQNGRDQALADGSADGFDRVGILAASDGQPFQAFALDAFDDLIQGRDHDDSLAGGNYV